MPSFHATDSSSRAAAQARDAKIMTNIHRPDCIDHTTCDGMLLARDSCIHAQARELGQLRDENGQLRSLVMKLEHERDLRAQYEQYLRDIGRLIGCDHLDDRLPSCVKKAIFGRPTP